MHTILGAGGAVANALTRELANSSEKIRLVSRKQIANMPANATWQQADLLKYDEVLAAVKGSKVIYLTAGLVYDIKIWRAQWPVLMQNVINAAKETQARVIFFDNVYMYGQVNGPMTESTPYSPCSEKGEVRAQIATKLMDEAIAGNISATIARAADFYGTENKNGFFDLMVMDKFAHHHKVQWIGNPDYLHSFSFIPDMGKGLFLLGQNEGTSNQIWHMPTAKAKTGKEFLEIAAKAYNEKPNYMAINKLMMTMVGWFDPLVKSSVEMYYQYVNDYIFDSSKFEQMFNYKPFSYEAGIKIVAETIYKAE